MTTPQERPVGGSGSRGVRAWLRYAGRVLLWMLVLVTVAAVLWLWAGGRRATAREDALASRLAAQLGVAPDTLTAPAPASAAADRLVAAAAALGLGLVPEGVQGYVAPAPGPAAAFAAMAGPLDAWVAARLGSDSPEPIPPPDAVVSYLDEHGPQLHAVVAVLADVDQVRFAERTRLVDRTALDSGAYVRLHWLMAALALSAPEDGDAVAVEEPLEAGWDLNRILMEDRDPGVFPAALEVARLHAGVIGVVLVEPEPWIARLAGVDVQALARQAWCADGWRLVEAVRTGAVWSEVEQGGVWPPIEPLVRPWLRLGAVESAELTLAAVADLAGENVLAVDVDTAEQVWRQQLSEWNALGIAQWTSPLALLRQAAVAAVSLELARRVLELRQYHETAGEWPEALAAPDSTALPGRRWSYRADADGSVSLALAPAPGEDAVSATVEGPGVALPTASQREAQQGR